MDRAWLIGRLARTDDDTPMGIDLAVAAVAIVLVMFMVSQIPRTDPTARCLVIALAIGVFAAISADPAATAAIVPITWLLMNGFLVNRLGTLSWHGTSDLYRLTALTGAALLGLAIAAGSTARRQR